MIVKLESDEAVQDFIAQGNGYLYFSADWCQPCVVYGPRVASVAAEKMVTVGKVNADFTPGTLRNFQIKSIPTLVKLNSNDGTLVEYHVGVQDVEFLDSFFN